MGSMISYLDSPMSLEQVQELLDFISRGLEVNEVVEFYFEMHRSEKAEPDGLLVTAQVRVL